MQDSTSRQLISRARLIKQKLSMSCSMPEAILMRRDHTHHHNHSAKFLLNASLSKIMVYDLVSTAIAISVGFHIQNMAASTAPAAAPPPVERSQSHHSFRRLPRILSNKKFRLKGRIFWMKLPLTSLLKKWPNVYNFVRLWHLLKLASSILETHHGFRHVC